MTAGDPENPQKEDSSTRNGPEQNGAQREMGETSPDSAGVESADGVDEANPSKGWRPLLRRADQAVVGVILLLAIGLFGVYGYRESNKKEGWIEIDRATRQKAAFQVDLNQADWPELAQLPGIGETLGRRIVESRREQGPFTSLDDLQRVKGIGPRTLERMRPYLLPMAESGTIVGNPLLLEYE